MGPTILLLAAAAQQAALPATIEGRWSNPKRSVTMVIAPCGAELCGTVEWASEEAQRDASKGTGELVGSQLLTALKPRRDGRYQGRLYIPDKRMRVTARIEPIGANQLKVSGCALGKALCRTQFWDRAGGK